MKLRNGRMIVGFGTMVTLFLLLILPVTGPQAQQRRWDAVSHDSTNFPLTGKHRTVACSECHLKGVLQGTPRECEVCHWFRKQDDRYQLQLGIHCADCHTPLDWKTVKAGAWEHGEATGFTLEGIHKSLDCYRCHRGKIFSSQRRDCLDCHRGEYEGAAEPNHVLNQFPTDCKICHTMTAWESARYYHQSFPLNGLHRTADCAACHKQGQFAGTPTDCAACHLDQYNQTRDPNHRQANYPLDCELCHGSSALDWQGATIDHDRFWPIRGAHKGLDCRRCHYKGYDISSQCVACHLDDYNNTRDPNHRQAGFHTDCEVCHPPEAFTWGQAVFYRRFP